jgi:fructose-bisphosphate aldolase class II
MPLVSGHDVIAACTSRGLVAGAFNTTNLETTMGIVEGVERAGVPTFVQCAPTNAVLSGFEYIYDLVARRLASCDVPVALHLDHGKTLGAVEDALAARFTSIMIDASEEPYDENVATSAKARELCGPDIALEAELGSIGGKEDEVGADLAAATDPAQVAGFVDAVGCDMLAVSVGNVHGHAPDARIDFERLAAVREACPVPLVIHGGSGLPAEQLARLHELGVVKVSVSKDAVHAVADVVERRIRMFNPLAT